MNLNTIIEQMIEYSESVNSSKIFGALRELWSRAYGMDFYNQISLYIDSCITNAHSLDMRIFHFLYEHKLIMEKRMEHLLKSSIITEHSLLLCWTKIKNSALTIRNTVIKGNLSGRYDVNNLTGALQLLRREEASLLERTISHLELCKRPTDNGN